MTTINPYGEKYHTEHKKEECWECGLFGDKEFIIFEQGFPDGMSFCSKECVLAYFQKLWAESNIEYVNSKKKEREV